ncbi:MAG TPA: hypothetical protein VF787_28505 [Thermoanaerobaculia bacterium]
MIHALLLASALTRTVVDHGIAVDLKVSEAITDGESLHVELTLRDDATKAPLTGVRPLAWLAPRSEKRECMSEAARFLGGSLTDRPAADFNDFYVLALNDQPSISVVDPRFRFGRSQLLSLILLESRGEDWVLTPDGRTLFVTMPEAGKVAIADTATWKVRANVAMGTRPTRIALQPDGARVWVVSDDGVYVLDASSVERQALSLPKDARRAKSPPLHFTADSRIAMIGNAIIDTRTFESHTIDNPIYAYSNLAYAGDPATGRIQAIDPTTRKTLATFEAEKQFTQIRFAPNGRHGFIVNPAKNVVQIFDAATNTIIATADIPDAPDQVTFTDRIAFVRRRNSDSVSMITLDTIKAGAPVGVAEFSGGQRNLGAGDFAASADSIVEAPDGPAVLVANPADKSIYYYKEGMAAPMGAFANYSRQPRAVLVVDRSLREKKPGVYASRAQIADPGAYELVVFLDSPRLAGCFPIDVAARPETRAKLARAVYVEPLAVPDAHAGEKTRITFRIAERESHRTRNGGDVEIVVMQAPGVWQRRAVATPSSDGTYAVEVTPPQAGVYYVWVASPVADLPINNGHFITFEAD